MTAEDGFLRWKTWHEEATWSEKCTEIFYVGNESHYYYITSGERLSYGYIEKIIHGIWQLAVYQKMKSKKNLRLLCLLTSFDYLRYRIQEEGQA